MKSSRFEEIPCNAKFVQDLEEILLKRLPRSVHVIRIRCPHPLYYILVLLKLASQRRFPDGIDMKLFIYCDDDDIKLPVEDEDNLFIVCIQRPNFHTKKGVVLLPPQNPTPEHIAAFDRFIGWDESQIFHTVPPPFWDPLLELCQRNGRTTPENSARISCILYAITDVDKAKNLEVKDFSDNPGIVVKPLEKSNARDVVGPWKWSADHSEDVIRMCIGSVPTVGVFDKGEIASHVLMSPIGLFNVLYTPPKFRNKGLGQFVMRWISRETARQWGTTPIAEVIVDNEPSKKALINAGYEEVYYSKWFCYEPEPRT